MTCSFANGDRARYEKGAGNQHQIDERGQRDVDAGMEETAGMAIDSFVQILIRGLQVEIGDRVLDQEHGDGGKRDEGEVRHRRYFERASAVPSHCGGGGFTRK